MLKTDITFIHGSDNVILFSIKRSILIRRLVCVWPLEEYSYGTDTISWSAIFMEMCFLIFA